MNELASRYALALYSIASEGNLAEWQKEMKELGNILLENKEFLAILSSGFMSFNEKEEIIDKTLVGVKQEIKSLLKLMIKNRRANYISEVFYEFNSLCNKQRGVKEGLVYSVVALDKNMMEQICQKIGQIEGCQVELYNKIDSTLIGGIKVVIDSHIYDGSIKEKIAQLKSNLL